MADIQFHKDSVKAHIRLMYLSPFYYFEKIMANIRGHIMQIEEYQNGSK